MNIIYYLYNQEIMVSSQNTEVLKKNVREYRYKSVFMLSKQIFLLCLFSQHWKNDKKFFDKTVCKALNHNSNLDKTQKWNPL